MAFEIRPLKEFLVRPALPQQLDRMAELAYNIVWSWDPAIRSVFRRLDPALWSASGRNPVLMLGEIGQDTLEHAAGDPRFQSLYRRACERYRTGDDTTISILRRNTTSLHHQNIGNAFRWEVLFGGLTV